MERSRSELAYAVDGLVSGGRATVTESRYELALYQLDADGARQVVERLDAAGFTLVRLTDDGGEIPIDALEDGAIGIELLARKPSTPDGILPVLSRAGFHSILERGHVEPIIWLHGLLRPIVTATVAYLPWNSNMAFSPDDSSLEPAKVVRYLGEGLASEPIGRWLLRDPETDTSGSILAGWRKHASRHLALALAQEVERDGRLLFRGPPPTRFRLDATPVIEANQLSNLQRAAGWVYGNVRELENRHGLMAAEIARAAQREGDLIDLSEVAGNALEGARIAYGFGVSQQSRDALKTLSDLRKAVTDETGKLSDSTRALAAAVMTSSIGNVGLVIARLTIAKDATFAGWAAAAVGLGLAVYVAVVIASGWHFLSIQRDLRRHWRERLYRFLGDEEYARMVTDPVKRAERGFRNAAIGSAFVAVVELAAVMAVVLG